MEKLKEDLTLDLLWELLCQAFHICNFGYLVHYIYETYLEEINAVSNFILSSFIFSILK